MENSNCLVGPDGTMMRLPIGYRFRPTDEELLVHYLNKKILGLPFPASVIPDHFDVFQTDPWILPGDLNEKRYFFGRRNVSNRTIRAGSGYWKYIRNKDKQVQTSSALLGVKKTLVFYRGKNRTRWVMHEYRLNTMSEGEWVVHRIFQQKRKANKRRHNRQTSVDVAEAPQPSVSTCSSEVIDKGNALDQEEETTSRVTK